MSLANTSTFFLPPFCWLSSKREAARRRAPRTAFPKILPVGAPVNVMTVEAFVIYIRKTSLPVEASRAPSTRGALAAYGAAIMAPSLGATDTPTTKL